MNFLNFDGYGDDDPPDAKEPTCNRCGQGGLWWVDTGQRWRLMDGNKPHMCKATADDFDVVP